MIVKRSYSGPMLFFSYWLVRYYSSITFALLFKKTGPYSYRVLKAFLLFACSHPTAYSLPEHGHGMLQVRSVRWPDLRTVPQPPLRPEDTGTDYDYIHRVLPYLTKTTIKTSRTPMPYSCLSIQQVPL